MTHGVSGETMNAVYDEFRTMTVDEIERFKSLVTVKMGTGEISECEYYLMMHQACHALSRGWHLPTNGSDSP